MTDNYMTLRFRTKALMFLAHEHVDATVRRAATKKFHLKADEFKPDASPVHVGTKDFLDIDAGSNRTFHIYDVQVTADAAKRIEAERPNDLMAVYATPTTTRAPWGAKPPHNAPGI